jgi:hypothetical protein
MSATKTKRHTKAAKLHALRRDLIEHSWIAKQAKKHGNVAIANDALLERDITLAMIRDAKQGNSR